MKPAEIDAIARTVAKSGAFIAATCPTCHTTNRPYRDTSVDDGKACERCIKTQAACPGCNRGSFPITGNWHDSDGRWHRECAIKAGRAPVDIYAPMMLRKP